MSHLFLHISTDFLLADDGHEQLHIPYDDMERRISAELVEYIRERKIESVYVLNGPGSFTLLRIGALFLNMLRQVAPHLSIYELSKPDFYASAIRNGNLPPRGVVFSGQRKKMQLMTWSAGGEMAMEYVTIKDASTKLEGEDYWIDLVEEHQVVEVLDQQKRIREMRATQEGIVFHWNDEKFLVPYSLFQSVKGPVLPNYMMEPTIGG